MFDIPPLTPERVAAQETVRAVRARITELGPDGLDLLFREARSHNGWTDRPVPPDLLKRLYETIRFMPTSNNSSPARFVFVTSAEGKAKLVPALGPANVAKVEAAPVTAIIATDERFWTELPRLFPHEDRTKGFRDDPARAVFTADLNGTLQGAYLMLAARALGLDVGPMSGFDRAKVDAAFFAGTSLKSLFLCNLGYGDETKLFQRLPRLSFEEACTIV